MINISDIVYIINNDVNIMKKLAANDTFHLQYTEAVTMLRKLNIRNENTYLKYADTIKEFKNFSYLDITSYDRLNDNEYFKIVDTIFKSQENIIKPKKM